MKNRFIRESWVLPGAAYLFVFHEQWHAFYIVFAPASYQIFASYDEFINYTLAKVLIKADGFFGIVGA